MKTNQSERVSRFLQEHPEFWSERQGEDEEVCGFRVDGWFLPVDEMDSFLSLLGDNVPAL
jgi:hypothetical protein